MISLFCVSYLLILFNICDIPSPPDPAHEADRAGARRPAAGSGRGGAGAGMVRLADQQRGRTPDPRRENLRQCMLCFILNYLDAGPLISKYSQEASVSTILAI